MTGTSYAANIQIQGKGWYIFGGNDLETSQKLVDISSNWEAGPAVQTPGIQGQCAVQVMKFVERLIVFLNESRIILCFFRSMKQSQLSLGVIKEMSRI